MLHRPMKIERNGLILILAGCVMIFKTPILFHVKIDLQTER